MPKLVTRCPKYARHKASKQAVVKIKGTCRYLRPWVSLIAGGARWFLVGFGVQALFAIILGKHRKR